MITSLDVNFDFNFCMSNLIRNHNCIENKDVIMEFFNSLDKKRKSNILYVEKYGEFIPFISMYAAGTTSTVYGCSFKVPPCFSDNFNKYYTHYFKYSDLFNPENSYKKIDIFIYADMELDDEDISNFPSRFNDIFYMYKDRLNKDCLILYKPIVTGESVLTFPGVEVVKDFGNYIIYRCR